MYNVNDVTKIKSVTGDNFITREYMYEENKEDKEDKEDDIHNDIHEIIITFN